MEIPEAYRSLVRCGTCSWKYPSWSGLLYREDKRYRAHEYLADYAGRLDTVEVDQWFWSLFPGGVTLPDPATVRTYAESVPDGFVFTIKAPNALTLTNFYARQPKRHAEYANKPNPHFLDPALLEAFLDRLAPLGSKMGPIMLQFEYLNRKKMPSVNAFLKALRTFAGAAPAGVRLAVETRKPNYLAAEFFDLLRACELGFVFLEGYYMPPIADVARRFDTITTDYAIIRLHGGDREGIEKRSGGVWNRILEPHPEGLEAAARIARTNAERGVRTYVNVNNHYEGSAPLTVDRFAETLAALQS